MQQVYLDNAATTQMRTSVITAITETMTTYYGNPSSSYRFGRDAKTLIETSRKTVAKLLNASTSEIIFTSGGTEANNFVLRSAVRDLHIKHIISTRIEHHAVLYTIEALKREYAVNVMYLDVDAHGNIDVTELETLLENHTDVLVSLMHVNNEIGNILDIKAIGDLCYKNNALFHTDAVQSVGHFNLDLNHCNIDFLTASAHKFHGPKGVGFAYVRKNTGIKALLYGGEQERGLRAGTESVHAIVGLEKALDAAYVDFKKDTEHLKALKLYFIAALQQNIPDITFNGYSGDVTRSSHTILNVRFPLTEKQTELFLFKLDLKGIACSRGSACQSGSAVKSHVLSEVLDSEALQKVSIRFSLSIFNTTQDIDYTLEVLKALVLKNAS